ncbi:MAG: 5'/3'-nucleotidase SurE [Anaeromicrobium sp.]|uniref:5'/3'-nucleotidase SurE n=1 Tax=Anaeromicrobium sp. TaxID=1929132 RepID=UPI0025E9A1FC|nr:5'/3'-nucleotidase SurE [Anaeromicrobium sp.]MCT4594700.1 5'/3'-nucleotidase SurE [Anaeromicrobium sp.]
MKILITNDDGIGAEGIYKLACELSKVGEIFIGAPDRQRSATGHGITMHEPLRARKVTFFDTDFEAWSISGTPADCVKLSIESLMDKRPDIVVSGINNGPNLGTDVLYSGTVSAAMEGVLLGSKGIAMSLAGFKNLDYAYAAEFARKLVENLRDKDIPEDTLLNVNIPNCSEENIKGVEITNLGVRKYKSSYTERIDPRGERYFWLEGEIVPVENGGDTDIHAIENHVVSVTPLHFDLTKNSLIDEVKNWNISI